MSIFDTSELGTLSGLKRRCQFRDCFNASCFVLPLLSRMSYQYLARSNNVQATFQGADPTQAEQ
jgi:hypothetical protein